MWREALVATVEGGVTSARTGRRWLEAEEVVTAVEGRRDMRMIDAGGFKFNSW